MMFVMGLFNFSLFIQRKTDVASFYLALFCLILALFTITKLRHSFYIFDDRPSLDSHITYISLIYYLGIGLVPLFGHFYHRQFPQQTHAWVSRALWIYYGVVVFLSLFDPLSFFSQNFIPIRTVAGAAIGYFFYCSFKVYRSNQVGGATSFFGVCFQAITSAWDMAVVSRLIDAPMINSLGVVVFLYCQSQIIGMRFSETFKRVQDLSKEREKMVQTLKEKEKARTLFFHNTSHELRTPLNGIIGFLDLIRSGKYGSINQILDQQLNKILGLSHSLKNQVNTILDLAKSHQGELDLKNQPVDMETLCQQTIVLAEGLSINKQGTDFSLNSRWDEAGCQFICDREKLITVIRNLLGNAFKFKSPKRDNHVTLSSFPLLIKAMYGNKNSSR